MHRFNGNSQCLMLSGIFFSENNGLISVPAIEELILLPLVFVKYCQEKRNRWIKKTRTAYIFQIGGNPKRIKQLPSPTLWQIYEQSR